MTYKNHYSFCESVKFCSSDCFFYFVINSINIKFMRHFNILYLYYILPFEPFRANNYINYHI